MEENEMDLKKVEIHISIPDIETMEGATTSFTGEHHRILGVLTSSIYQIASRAGWKVDEMITIITNAVRKFDEDEHSHQKADVSPID